MNLPHYYPGDKVRLRKRLFPGYPYVRFDQRVISRSDIPAGSPGVVRRTHGTEVLIEIVPNANNMTDRGVDVWLNYHMLDVLLAPMDSGSEAKQARNLGARGYD